MVFSTSLMGGGGGGGGIHHMEKTPFFLKFSRHLTQYIKVGYFMQEEGECVNKH